MNLERDRDSINSYLSEVIKNRSKNDEVYKLVLLERQRQRDKHGDKDFMAKLGNSIHAPISVIAEELGELATELMNGDLNRAISECIDLTASSFAFAEALLGLRDCLTKENSENS